MLSVLQVSNYQPDIMLTANGDYDPDNFVIEILERCAVGSTITATVEARKPPDGSRAFANTTGRLISVPLTCVTPDVYRSGYLRLVVDSADHNVNPAQTLLVGTDATDPGVEILGQIVRITYRTGVLNIPVGDVDGTITPTDPDDDVITVKLRAYYVPGITGVTSQTIQDRLNTYVRQAYAQVGIKFDVLGVQEFVQQLGTPPYQTLPRDGFCVGNRSCYWSSARQTVVCSQNIGDPASGQNSGGTNSTLSFNIRLIDDAGTRPNCAFIGSYTFVAGHTPLQTAQALKPLIEATPGTVACVPASGPRPQLQVQIVENPPAEDAATPAHRSVDVLVSANLPNWGVANIAVFGTDTQQRVSNTGNPSSGGSVSVYEAEPLGSWTQRATIYRQADPAETDVIRLFVFTGIVEPTYPSGTPPIFGAATPRFQARPNTQRGIDPIANNAFFSRDAADGTTNHPYTMAHEIGHVLGDFAHPLIFNPPSQPVTSEPYHRELMFFDHPTISAIRKRFRDQRR